jgi:hypothetical protein
MKNKDNSRKWMWVFLGVVVALQLYFVRELLAVFALFVLSFGALLFTIFALYALSQGWAVAVEGLAASQHPFVLSTKRRVNLLEEFTRRRLVTAFSGMEELAKRVIRASSATAR